MQLNVIITSVLSYYFSDYLVFHHVECFLFVARRRVLFTVIYSILFKKEEDYHWNTQDSKTNTFHK